MLLHHHVTVVLLHPSVLVKRWSPILQIGWSDSFFRSVQWISYSKSSGLVESQSSADLKSTKSGREVKVITRVLVFWLENDFKHLRLWIAYLKFFIADELKYNWKTLLLEIWPVFIHHNWSSSLHRSCREVVFHDTSLRNVNQLFSQYY